HEHPVGTLLFTPDGTLLASADIGQVVKLWVVAGGEVASLSLLPENRKPPNPGEVNRPVPRLAFTPDGRSLATSVTPLSTPGEKTSAVQIWEVGTLGMDGKVPIKERCAVAHSPSSLLDFVESGRVTFAGGGRTLLVTYNTLPVAGDRSVLAFDA